VNPNAAYLGVAADQVEKCGAKIIEVRGGSGADVAGLQPGDVIVAANDKAITGLEELRTLVRTSKPGDVLRLTYQRNGEQATVSVTLGPIPPDTIATQAATAAATAAATSAATAAK
jgi:S1-C subfamily serine protease